jgi:hypothetical protein
MLGSDILVFTLVVVSFLTWLVFVITACKFYKFFSEFEKYKSSNDVELNSLVWHAKKLDGSLAEVIAEMRRANKLLYEISIGKNAQPEVEVEFKTEDILRHNKMDINKTPTGHTSIDMEAIVAHNAIHKTPQPIAPTKISAADATLTAAMKNAAASVAAASIKSVPAGAPVSATHASKDTQAVASHESTRNPPPAATWLKSTPVNLVNSVHNTANQTGKAASPPSAQPSIPPHVVATHEHSPEKITHGGTHLKNTPADLDLAHIPPPPQDQSCKLSIDAFSSKSNQVDLKHLK